METTPKDEPDWLQGIGGEDEKMGEDELGGKWNKPPFLYLIMCLNLIKIKFFNFKNWKSIFIIKNFRKMLSNFLYFLEN